MNPTEAQRIPPEVLRTPSRQAVVLLPRALLYSRIAFGGAVLCAVGCLIAAFSGQGQAALGRWSAGACCVLASFVVLFCLGRRLPLQNIAAALLVSWAAAFLGLTLGVKSNFFFGEVVYAQGFGPKVLGILPWQVPFLWVAMVLGSRETARLFLRPWRRDRRYGYWLVGAAALLVSWTHLAVEPYAVHVGEWWKFSDSSSTLNWAGVPWCVFPSGYGLALVILAFVGPWLVAKRPLPMPPNYYPFALWLLLNVWCLIGNAGRGLWLVAAVTLVGMVAVALLVWYARTATVANPEAVPSSQLP